MIEGKNYSIVSRNSRIPNGVREFPFEKVIEKILGKKKNVSLVFIDESKMMELNNKYRKKDYSTDILSFPNMDGGEIFISMKDVKRKSSEYDILHTSYLYFLFIHGLLHLKGMTHGSKMDIQEKKFCKFFKLKHPLNNERDQDNSRNRYRNVRSPSGRK